HSLGVVHLMQQALEHLGRLSGDDDQTSHARAPMLAAAMIHDVGHGPFSHLCETCLGTDHEEWSRAIILCEETGVHQVLRAHFDPEFPRRIADLIDRDNQDQPAWQKYLLSSQLDMDRLDYLRRDSLCTGAGYGHFDWYRLLNTFEVHEGTGSGRDIVWPEKSLLAIEEYIFARYYMYHNVYLHKATRGFEKLLEAWWGGGRGGSGTTAGTWRSSRRSRRSGRPRGSAAGHTRRCGSTWPSRSSRSCSRSRTGRRTPTRR